MLVKANTAQRAHGHNPPTQLFELKLSKTPPCCYRAVISFQNQAQQQTVMTIQVDAFVLLCQRYRKLLRKTVECFDESMGLIF